MGKSPAEKPTGAQGQSPAYLTLRELESLIHKWIREVWLDSPCEGMQPLCPPGEQISPRTAVTLQVRRTGYADSYVDPYAPLILLRGKYAALSNGVVTILGLRYSNATLAALRDLPTADVTNRGKYHVRYDPRDMSGVWVFIPDGTDLSHGTWSYAQCRSVPGGLPFALSDVKYAEEMSQQGVSGETREQALHRFLTGLYTGENLSKAEAKVAALSLDRTRRARQDQQRHLPLVPPSVFTHDEALQEIDLAEDLAESPDGLEPFDDYEPMYPWLLSPEQGPHMEEVPL